MKKFSRFQYLKPYQLRYVLFCEGLGFRKASGQLSARIHVPKNVSRRLLKTLQKSGIFKIENKKLTLTSKGKRLLGVLK